MKKSSLVALGLFALFAMGASCDGVYTIPVASSNGSLNSRVAAKPIEFSAWLVFWDPLSVKSFQTNVGRLSRVYPEAYGCQADGLPSHIGTFDAGAMRGVVALAKAHGVKILGTMNNFANGDFEPKRVELFLGDAVLMEKHVDALIALATADGLRRRGVAISMDGRGRCLDNIFVERLWRSVKYEDVYIRGYESVAELRAGLARYFRFYNEERRHQSLGLSGASRGVPGGGMRRAGDRPSLPHDPSARGEGSCGKEGRPDGGTRGSRVRWDVLAFFGLDNGVYDTLPTLPAMPNNANNVPDTVGRSPSARASCRCRRGRRSVRP